MAFVRTLDELTEPDVQLYFLPFGYVIQPENRSAMTAFQPKENAMMLTVTLCQPRSQGRVRLEAESGKVLIDHQLFSNPSDLQVLTRGLKMAENSTSNPA